MKSLQVIILMGLALIPNGLSGQNMYYWSANKKHTLIVDSTRLIAVKNSRVSINKEEISERLNKSVLMLNDKFFLIQSQNKISDLFVLEESVPEATNFSYSYKLGENPMIPTGEIVLKPKKGIEISSIEKIYENEVLLIKSTKYNTHTFMINKFSDLLDVANSIYESGLVEWCHPDFMVEITRFQNDPLYPEQYYLNNTGQFGGTAGVDINAPQAWAISEGLIDVRVAVIDDGVENHADIAGRVLQGFTPRIPGGNGQPIISGIFDPAHGQACSGIIAATRDNNLGVAGISPCTDIIPINIFADPFLDVFGNLRFRETAQDIAAGINWAWDNGQADVLSNSWGFVTTDQNQPDFDLVIQAITDARNQGRNGLGSIVVFASGNSNQNFQGVTFPANVDGVLTVGAINNTGNIWNYSSRGPEMDLVAPSGNVNLLGDVRTTDRMGANGYEPGNFVETFGGTSAAAPQVSGVVALMLSVNSGLTEQQISDILRNTATDMGANGFDNTYGFGRINAFQALQQVMPSISGPEFVCTTNANFTLTEVPAGSTIDWSVLPVNLFTNDIGTGISFSTSANNNMFGAGTITATITNGCGQTDISFEVWVGKPSGVTTNPSGVPAIEAQMGSIFNIYVTSIPGATTSSLNWRTNRNSGLNLNPGYGVCVVECLAIGYNYVYVTSSNTCGTSSYSLIPVDVTSEGGGGQQFLSLSPNPSNGVFDIEIKDLDNSKLDQMIEIVIYDSYQNKVFQSTFYDESITIDLSHKQKGFYYLHLFYDQKHVQQTLIFD